MPVLRLPCGSAGKESACNAGDPGSIPRLGTSPGEGIGYLLQYSWASLVVQMVKNLLQCRRPGFDPRVEKDPLEEGMATHSSILAWRIPMDRGPWWATVLLLLSRFSRVRLCATPETATHEAPPSLGFSRQEHWSGLPSPSPMHETEK